MKSFCRKLLSRVGVLGALAGAVWLALLLYFRHEDERHTRYAQTGRLVNAFLGLYGQGLQEAFLRKDVAAVARFYSERYHSPGRGHWESVPDGTEATVALTRLEARGGQDYDKAAVTRALRAYLEGIARIDEVAFKINLIEQIEEERKVVLTVKFVLDGRDRRGGVFQDRHFYRWHLAREASGGGAEDWKIVRDELVEGVRVTGDGAGFEEADLAALGIDYRHRRDPHLDPDNPANGVKYQVMQHAAGGVCVVDYNNDGLPDLFFADGERCRLYRNDGPDASGQLRFTDVTAAAGLDGIGRANGAVFGDVDNDGHKDLFIVRYCAPCRFFRNNGDGTFTDRSREMGLDFSEPCTCACFLDYDRDGFLDLYVGVYGDAFKEVPRLPFYAQNGGKNRLFRNVGGKRFQDVTDASGTGDRGWALAVAAGDYDGDGFPDLAIANDFGRKCLYRNNGDGTFTEVAKRAGVVDLGGGMGVAFGDLSGAARLDLYFAGINSNQRWFGEDLTIEQYLRNVARTPWLWRDLSQYRELYRFVGAGWPEVGKMTGKGNSLYANNGDGTFRELADSHANRAGWSFGVALFDMDNDGDLDIFVANGWISNTPKTDL
jgi:hypothetical protein